MSTPPPGPNPRTPLSGAPPARSRVPTSVVTLVFAAVAAYDLWTGLRGLRAGVCRALSFTVFGDDRTSARATDPAVFWAYEAVWLGLGTLFALLTLLGLLGARRRARAERGR